MKSIIFLCTFLLYVSFITASHIKYPISIEHKLIGTWYDGALKQSFSQYDIILTNHGSQNVKQLVIGNNAVPRLRDSNSIWNVVVENDGDFILPSYQDINAGASYTFGYILKGTAPATLFIKNVYY